jgi:hypothetical protein
VKAEVDINPSIKWVNSGRWPSQKVSVQFEFYNGALCGDGVSVILLLNGDKHEKLFNDSK